MCRNLIEVLLVSVYKRKEKLFNKKREKYLLG